MAAIIGAPDTEGNHDINARNFSGNTPLHMAVEYEYTQIQMDLADAGADPLIKVSVWVCGLVGS